MPRAKRTARRKPTPIREIEGDEPEATEGDGEAADAVEEAAPKAAERVKVTPAPESVAIFCRKIMREHHKDLAEAGVTLCCVYASAGENAEGAKEALHVSGHPVVCKIKKANETDTANELADLTITIDMHRWKSLEEDRMQAEIDAVLCRVSPRREGNTDDGDFLVDANDRPKLRYNRDDIHIVGFKANVERFHKASPPTKALIKFAEENKQLLLFAKNGGESD